MDNPLPHADHDTVEFAEAHAVDEPRLHIGVLWCNDCSVELPALTF